MFCNTILRIIINNTILPFLPPKQHPSWLFTQWVLGGFQAFTVVRVSARRTLLKEPATCSATSVFLFLLLIQILTLGREQIFFLICLACWESHIAVVCLLNISCAAQVWKQAWSVVSLQLLWDLEQIHEECYCFQHFLALPKTRHTEIWMLLQLPHSIYKPHVDDDCFKLEGLCLKMFSSI